MSPAPVNTASPEIDRFLSGLIESKVLDGGRVRSAWDAYRTESASPEVHELAEFLVRRGLMTAYQAERAVAGDAIKLLLGPYLLLEPLGPAAFGTVFLAVHRGDRRRFAVKVLPLRSLWKVLEAKKQVARFQTAPPHRAVVPLVEIDTANGSHYLSWPYVEGESLESIVGQTGPLPAIDACRIFAEVAEGLATCHDAGLFHGMLNPGNILVGTDGRASVLDMGLGAILAENLEDESMLDTISTANSALEMMNYAAPETISEPSLRSATADVYNLGCVMYAVLAGELPFPEGSVVTKMIAHQTRMPIPICTLNPKLPLGLETLIVSMLQKDPPSRPRLRDVKESLDALAVALPVEAPSTVPFSPISLGVERIDELLAEVRSAHDLPNESPAESLHEYKASPIYQSSEGLIDFDVPPESHSAETPVSLRPAARMPEESPPPRGSWYTGSQPSEHGSSVPELLLPEGGVLRTLTLPTSAPPSGGSKSMPALPTPKKAWEPPPAPVNWTAAPTKRETQFVRPPVVLPPVPQFGSQLVQGLKKQFLFWKPTADTVQLSIFGAPEITPGQRVNFLVYAHSPEAYSNVVTLCRALRPEADLLGAGFLDVPVPRGVDVGIHLALTYAGVAKSLVKVTWIGQTQPRTFEVFVPWESPPGLASGVVTAGIEKTMVASIPLHFIIPARLA